MKLAIISHTEHYKTSNGEIVGWSPTVNEINHLLTVFDEIYHLAMLYSGIPPASTLAYKSNKIKFIPIPAVGGRIIKDKLNVIWQAPKTIRIVSKVLQQVDYFQLRTPTGIGVYLIPYLTLFSKKKGWFKYAGNWNQKHPPLGYALQRFMLKHQSRKININGRWKNQPSQCITFENPCLTETDIIEGTEIRKTKSIDNSVSFCFVGRLEREKGVKLIIEAFKMLSAEEKKCVGDVHLVGNGKEQDYFKRLSENEGIRFIFHGHLSRKDVINVYKNSHIFLLPTIASEGFPKVIAEAMNFGCLPIVSEISSIGQYIEDGINGYLLNPTSTFTLKQSITDALKLNTSSYRQILDSQTNTVLAFTFSHYNERIMTELL